MKLKYISFLFMLAFCKAIREDYFIDNDETSKDQNEDTSSPISLEYLQNSKVLQVNSNPSIENFTLFTNDSHHNKLDDTHDTDENMINNEITVGKRIYEDEYVYENDVDPQQPKDDNQSKVSKVLDLFKDYEYRYDVPATAERQVLRQDAELQSGYQTKEPADPTNITEPVEETSEKYLIDFYNLQPAGSKLIIGDTPDLSGFQKISDVSIWYVSENLPCWDLPVLYGELGESRHKKVFRNFGNRLKNVLERKEDETFSPKKLSIPVSQTVNKWCSAEPCYGDHTLCLFPKRVNSKLCMSDYEVRVPSMAARIALVHTVNSMRNRVATGVADLYKHLPTAADMKQMIYDFDLQAMSRAWLHQCLPGPSACSSLEGNYVSQLECTKYTEHCCVNAYKIERGTNCIPQHECFINAITGCIHTWFRSAKYKLTATDVKCGHITPHTFNTVQLLWAKTNKIGCAYTRRPGGDTRVVCNFAPGAPFSISTKSFCGFIKHKEMIKAFSINLTSPDFLVHLGIALHTVKSFNFTDAVTSQDYNYSLRFSDVDILSKVYPRRWIRKKLNEYENSTLGFIARLVTKYTFGEESGPQCDTNKHIYEPGEPGSSCVEKGRRFHALCYNFRDPTPGYRLVAVLAPIALFSLILYDLFSGVVRQTNY